MPSLDDVYRKVGEVSEAAQLLETQLGTMLLMAKCIDEDLLSNPDVDRATAIYKKINKHTLGKLINELGMKTKSIEHLQEMLDVALKARNRLSHTFYLRHNLRRNSEEGRAIMLNDLESMHDKILNAYKAVMLLSGIDLDKLVSEEGNVSQPAGHLPI